MFLGGQWELYKSLACAARCMLWATFSDGAGQDMSTEDTPPGADPPTHYSARALLDAIFAQVHHLSEGSGRTAGQLDEVARQLTNVGATLHAHIEEEVGLVARLDDLSAQSRKRHEAIHERLDDHAAMLHRAAGARSLAKWLIGGIGSLLLMFLGAVLQSGAEKHVLSALGASVGSVVGGP